jgi:hypothetical protein
MTEAVEAQAAPVVEAPSIEEVTTETTAETVETPAPATEEPQVEQESEEKKQSRFQRRLDRQKAARIAAETEARLLREQLDRVAKSPVVTEKEPTREQFENYEDYIQARAEWRAEKKAEELVEKRFREQGDTERRAKETQHTQNIGNQWTKREEAYSEANPDYEDLVVPFVQDELQQVDQTARRAIVESDLGPNILHYLAKHPEEAERIAELSPIRQVAEIGKIEVIVSKPQPKKASNAPEPISPVGAKAKVDIDPSEMDQAQFNEWRRKRIAARR